MASRLVGILACLLVANVLNYALGQWLDGRITQWTQGRTATVDGSSLNTSRYQAARGDTTLALDAPREALLDYYNWVDEGGNRAYAHWRAATTALPPTVGATDPTVGRALALAGRTNVAKYLSLLLLLASLLLLYGGMLDERHWLAALLYAAVTILTAYFYGRLISPVWTGFVALCFVVYYGAIGLCLPLYRAEWIRTLRPSLTPALFLLGVMALRGPGLVDYWFWTSPLFRLLLLTVLLFAAFFHLAILTKVMRTAGLDRNSRILAYGMPLGIVATVAGLALGFYGSGPVNGLTAINGGNERFHSGGIIF